MIHEVNTKKKTGRPRTLDREKIKKEFAKCLLEGGRIRFCCKQCNIDKSTIYAWLNEDSVFADQYTHAREIYVDNFIEEMINDVETVGEDKLSIQKQKLIADVKLNLLEKIFPKRYGKHVNVDHTLELMSERIKRIRVEEEARISGNEQVISEQKQLVNRHEIGTSDSDAIEAEFDD